MEAQRYTRVDTTPLEETLAGLDRAAYNKAQEHAANVYHRLLEFPLPHELREAMYIASLFIELATTPEGHVIIDWLIRTTQEGAFDAHGNKITGYNLLNYVLGDEVFHTVSEQLEILSGSLNSNDKSVFLQLLDSCTTFEEFESLVAATFQNSQAVYIIERCKEAAFLRLVRSTTRDSVSILSGQDALLIEQEVVLFQRVQDLLLMRTHLIISDLSLLPPRTSHMPQFDIGLMYFLARRLDLLSYDSHGAIQHMNANRLGLFACIVIDTETRIAQTRQTVSQLPVIEYISREAAVIYNAICPFLLFIGRFYSGTEYEPLMQKLSGLSHNLFEMSAMILVPNLGPTVLRTIWSPLLGIPYNKLPPVEQLVDKLDREGRIVAHILNTILLKFLTEYFDHPRTVDNLARAGALSTSGRDLQNQPFMRIPFSELLAIITYPARVVKGLLPSLWKGAGLRLYDSKKRAPLTPAIVIGELLPYPKRETLQSRLDRIRQATAGRFISDLLTITTVLPVKGLAFIKGFYTGTSTPDKSKVALNDWVYKLVQIIEGSVEFDIRGNPKPPRFTVLTIDAENAKRHDQPFIQLIIFDRSLNRVFEWRIFRWDERHLVNISHFNFKHAIEAALYLLQGEIDVTALQYRGAPLNKSIPIRVYQEGESSTDIILEPVRSGRPPTQLDIAIALKKPFLFSWLNANPPQGYMTEKLSISQRNSSLSKPTFPLEPKGQPSIGKLIQAVNQASTDAHLVRDFIQGSMGLSSLEVFINLLVTAGLLQQVHIPSHQTYTFSPNQQRTIDDILNGFFSGYISLQDFQRIAQITEVQEIITYIERILGR
jgi:hypothetical protein